LADSGPEVLSIFTVNFMPLNLVEIFTGKYPNEGASQ
jgi:hypothetical protein